MSVADRGVNAGSSRADRPISNPGVPASQMNSQALTQLTDEEELFRDAVRDFARSEIGPRVKEMDEREKFDPDLLRQFFELNLMGIQIPQQLGGAEGSFFMSVLAVEELSRVDPSAAVIVDVQNTLVNNALLNWGNQPQKNPLPFPFGHRLGGGLRAVGGGRRQRCLCTPNAGGGKGRSLFPERPEAVDHQCPGGRPLYSVRNPGPRPGISGNHRVSHREGLPRIFRVGKKEEKLGIRASSTCELVLDHCRVPAENVLGQRGKGYKVSIETLNEGRIGIAAQMIGLAAGALEQATRYAGERQQFGQSLSKFQAIRFQIAELSTELEAARLLTYNAARMKDAGTPFLKEAAMAKYYASQVAERIASEVIEIFGGYGYTRDYPVEKFYRDAKIGKIYEGTSFMQLETIARAVLKDRS